MSKDSKTEFINNLKKSSVIDADRLTEWLSVTKAETPNELAKYLVRDELLTKWQAKYLLSGRSRLEIASYQLLDRTSRDKLGDRFLAVHTSLARKVDLQVFSSELTEDETRCKPFLKKASQIAKLDHPNLVHVYDIDQEGGRYFLVTEHVDGTTLDEIPRTQITEEDVARVLDQAIKGITHAHENDIIHGNIQQTDLILVDKQHLKIQNLAISPLREHSESEPTSDFKAIRKIAVSLLKEIPEKKRTEKYRDLAVLLNAFDYKDPDSIQATSKELANWVGSDEPEAAGLDSDSADDFMAIGDSDPFASGDSLEGFDQPIAGSVATSVRRKKKTSKSNSKKSAQLDEAVAAKGFGKLWKKNPVAVIATAGVLGLGLIGGSGLGIYSYLNSSSDTPAVAEKAKEDQPGEAILKDKQPEDKQPDVSATKGGVETIDVTKFRNPILESTIELGPDGDKKKVPAKTPVKFLGSQAKGYVEIEVKLKDDVVTSGWIETNLIVDGDPITQVVAKSSPLKETSKDDFKEEVKVASTEDNSRAGTIRNVANAVPDRGDLKDLTRLHGVGEETQKSLRLGKVETINQIAAMSGSEIEDALLKGGMKKRGSAKPIEWIQEAKKIIGDKTPIKESVASKSQQPATKKPAVDLSTPFKNFPRLTGLPAITDTKEFQIAPLKISQAFLLGAEMICEPKAVSKTKLIFEMTRSPDDKQKWIVGVKRRAKEKPANIAEFRKSPDAFFFKWLPEAAENKYAEFLRNCHVKLKTPDDEATFLALRKPIRVPDLRYFAENMTNQREITIPASPNPENIVIELLPPNVKGLALRPIVTRIEPRQPGKIELRRKDRDKGMWIQISGNARSKLQLQTNVMAMAFGRESSMSSLDEVSNFIESLKVDAGQAAQANEAKQSEKKEKNKDRKKQQDKEKAEFKKRADQAQNAVKKALEYKDILSKAANKPLHVRVYAKFGNLSTQLVVTDDKLPQPESGSKKKKKKKSKR